jgi:hypothetical protein
MLHFFKRLHLSLQYRNLLDAGHQTEPPLHQIPSHYVSEQNFLKIVKEQ